MLIFTGTRIPLCTPGMNLALLTIRKASSSHPAPIPRAIEALVMLPSG